MSSKHRHGLPRKRPGSTKKQAIEAELPAVESGGEVAPAAASGPVSIQCEASGDDGVDTLVTISVPEMPKKEVAAAVEKPLQRAVTEHRSQLRFQRVVVNFTGEALIGSAIKDLVKECLAPAKPVKVTVRRGYGDEVVLEGEAPKLEVETAADGDATAVTVGTGDLEVDDLPGLFAPVLSELASKASGAKFAFKFTGSAKPDSAMREQIGATLSAAGAVRAAVGARVLFDRELTDRCQVDDGGDDVVVTIDPAADPAVTGEAMETVLPDHALGFAGRAIRVVWKSPPDHGEGDHLVRVVSTFAPEHIEFVHGGGEPEVVWPSVLELVTGKEMTLRVRPNGRSHTQVLEAFPRECADLEGELRDHAVVIDWPNLFVIDEDTERCIADSMAGVGPKTVSCTVAGENREPFLPPPVRLADEEDRCVVSIDTDAGKPVELVRAIERAMPRFADRVSGKPARVVISGSSPASRTLLRAVLDPLAEAGPTRLELEDHGPVDVLLPPMLAIARSGEQEARIEVDLRGRNEAQQALALKRELDEGAVPKDAVITIVESPLDEALVEALIGHGAESVTTASGAQLHPEPLPEPEPEPEPELLPEPEPEIAAAAPAADAIAAATPVAPAPAPAGGPSSVAVRVLAQNNEAMPPTVLIGVDAGSDPAHVTALEGELAGNLARFQRRAVMVVLQQGGQDVPVRGPNELVSMLGRVLSAAAAATLIFRGPDAQGRPHFQVLHSSLRAMPIGATFMDPRQAS